MKKITALFLALALCLSLCTVTAFAMVNLPYSFDFETDPFENGWTTFDADGDGYDWKTDTDFGWAHDPGFGVDESHCVVSRSDIDNIGHNADNWLFSPAITIPAGGATVSWYEQSQDPTFPDSYTVYVGETAVATEYNESTAPNGMKVLYAKRPAANPWMQISVELSAENYGGKTVYIAFRHQSENCYFLEIDDFAVEPLAATYTVAVADDITHGTVTATPTANVASGTEVTLTVTPGNGYQLDSLTVTKQGGGTVTVTNNTSFTMPNDNVTVTAVFEAIPTYYTVTFDANGHGTAPAAITNVASGTKINKPTDPTAAGYTFGGWYKEAGCTNAWNFDTDTVTANTTVYAKWTATGGGNPNPGHGYSAPSDHLVTSDLTSVTKVTVDGKVVDSKYYTVSGGNVTLTDAFMKTLANGKHTVKLYNGDVVATGTMTVSGNAAVVSAKTADAGIALYGVLTVSSLLGMGWVAKKKH